MQFTNAQGNPTDVSPTNALPAKTTWTPRLTGQVVRPAQATQYTIGDHIANSLTAADVTPMSFTLPRNSGRVYGARATITPGSGSLVITACAIDLLLFRPEASIPFAAAGYPKDNDAFTMTAAMYKELVGIISFTAAAWRNTLGGLTAGAVGWQAAKLASARAFAPFNVEGLGGTLTGVLVAADVWNPGNVVQTIDIALDTDID